MSVGRTQIQESSRMFFRISAGVALLVFALLSNTARAWVVDVEAPVITVTGSAGGGGYVGDRPGAGPAGPAGSPIDNGGRDADGVVPVVDTTPRRKEPGCQREASILAKTIAEAIAAGPSEAKQPGREIMAGTKWGNPAYSDQAWTKRQYNLIRREVEGGVTRRYQVTVHYMFNKKTGQVDDFKLVNKIEDGCQGTVVSA